MKYMKFSTVYRISQIINFYLGFSCFSFILLIKLYLFLRGFRLWWNFSNYPNYCVFKNWRHVLLVIFVFNFGLFVCFFHWYIPVTLLWEVRISCKCLFISFLGGIFLNWFHIFLNILPVYLQVFCILPRLECSLIYIHLISGYLIMKRG